MGTYTITDVVGEPREWEGKWGKNLSYKLTLKDVDGLVELSQKPETPAPTVGQELEGEIQPSTNGNFPPRFKRVQRDGNRGFGGGMSPEREKKIVRQHSAEREKKIVRQHSAEMALRYAAIQQQRGALPDDFSLDQLKPIIDWFDKDAGL